MDARGKRVILAGEKEVPILFTNRALAEAEQAMGKSAFVVARGLATGQSGVGDIAQLLRAGMQAARRDAGERPVAVSLDNAYEILDEAGIPGASIAVIEAVVEVLSYNPATNGHGNTDPN